MGVCHQAFGQQPISGTIVIGTDEMVNLADSNFIREIIIKRKVRRKSYKQLVQQAIDSTSQYNGNCFQVTYFNKSPSTHIAGLKWPDYLRGKIYKINGYPKRQFKIEALDKSN